MSDLTGAEGAEDLIARARALALRRVAIDPLRTPESIEWAARRLRGEPGCGLGPDGRPSLRIVTVRLMHLAGQRAALDAAHAELCGARGVQNVTVDAWIEQLNQGYEEILRTLAQRPYGCSDHGLPSADAARAQLALRARGRGRDEWRRRQRVTPVADAEATVLPASADGDEVAAFRRRYRELRSGLPAGDVPKLDRFVANKVFGVDHATIAREHGMTHDAVRQESSRLVPRLQRIVADTRWAS